MSLPRIAYIALWFPKPSETFVLREAASHWQAGVPLTAYSLYGRLDRDLTPEMHLAQGRTQYLGLAHLPRLGPDLLHWLWRSPGRFRAAWSQVPCHPWRSAEVAAENLWAFLCGFSLARRLLAQRVQHIHAVWATGPATAAWTASLLSGIPFSFTGRAWDIYPSDGALTAKMAAAAFVTTDNMTNLTYLRSLAGVDPDKVHGVYNGVPLQAGGQAPLAMRPPYRLLALGRLVAKKGFEVLLAACGLLREAGLDFRLTLAGSGPLESRLKEQASQLGLAQQVEFPGFVRHDRVAELIMASDLLVMPSVLTPGGDRDGLPTVILEALAHGLPVVATDVCGISEVVQSGRTGWLVPQGDAAVLARAMAEALSDRARARKLAQAGRDLVLANFDPAINHARLMELIKNAARPAGREAAPPKN